MTGPIEVGATASTRSSAERKVPSLDGLRAAAIIVVFLAHSVPQGLRTFLAGGIGVSIFFFLSGFLITTLLRREYETTGGISYRDFYLRRFLRIYPPLTAMLGLVWLLCETGLLRYDFGLQTPTVAWLQLSNYWILARGEASLPPGSSVLWSLAVEEHFYLLFPLLFVFLRRRFARPIHQAVVLWAICFAFLLWRLCLAIVLHAPSAHLWLASDTRLDSILFGCAFAIVANPALDRTQLSKTVWTCIFLPVGVLGLMAARLIPGGEGVRESAKYTVQGLAFMGIFGAAVRYPKWGPLCLLNLRPVVFLGILSYSFYLVHATLLALGEAWLPHGSLALMAGAFGASVLVAWVFQVLVERPANRVRRRFVRLPDPTPLQTTESQIDQRAGEGGSGVPTVDRASS